MPDVLLTLAAANPSPPGGGFPLHPAIAGVAFAVSAIIAYKASKMRSAPVVLTVEIDGETRGIELQSETNRLMNDDVGNTYRLTYGIIGDRTLTTPSLDGGGGPLSRGLAEVGQAEKARDDAVDRHFAHLAQVRRWRVVDPAPRHGRVPWHKKPFRRWRHFDHLLSPSQFALDDLAQPPYPRPVGSIERPERMTDLLLLEAIQKEKKSRRAAWLTFVAGMAMSIPLGLLVNWFSSAIGV